MSAGSPLRAASASSSRTGMAEAIRVRHNVPAKPVALWRMA